VSVRRARPSRIAFPLLAGLLMVLASFGSTAAPTPAAPENALPALQPGDFSPYGMANDLVINDLGGQTIILVVGEATNQSNVSYPVVAAYEEDGAIDYGIIISYTNIVSSSIRASANAVEGRPDGGFTVAATISSTVVVSDTIFMADFDVDGDLNWKRTSDSLFGNGGASAEDLLRHADGSLTTVGTTYFAGVPHIYLGQFSAGGTRTGANQIQVGNGVVGSAIDTAPSGKFAVGGAAEKNCPPGLFDYCAYVTALFNPNRTPDTAYGNEGNGIAVRSFAGPAYVNGLLVQPDNKTVLAGKVSDLFALYRANANGSDDTTFGPGGLYTFQHPDGSPFLGEAVDIDQGPDGQLYATGYGQPAGSADRNAYLVTRINGGPYLTFNLSTSVPRAHGPPPPGAPHDQGRAIALQPDGKIVIAGALGGQFAVWRRLPNGAPDPTFGNGGLVITRFAACGAPGPPPAAGLTRRLLLPAIRSGNAGCFPVV
jgi:uncharacterized delta-60 repeat protein